MRTLEVRICRVQVEIYLCEVSLSQVKIEEYSPAMQIQHTNAKKCCYKTGRPIFLAIMIGLLQFPLPFSSMYENIVELIVFYICRFLLS
jgi:hypothetical protein